MEHETESDVMIEARCSSMYQAALRQRMRLCVGSDAALAVHDSGLPRSLGPPRSLVPPATLTGLRREHTTTRCHAHALKLVKKSWKTCLCVGFPRDRCGTSGWSVGGSPRSGSLLTPAELPAVTLQAQFLAASSMPTSPYGLARRMPAREHCKEATAAAPLWLSPRTHKTTESSQEYLLSGRPARS